jgi:transcriptional regulator with XRE-family HTH domain
MNYRIKEICKEQGITLSELADRIEMKSANLSVSLSEKENPTITTLMKIANALGVPFSDLFTQPKENTVNCPYCGGRIKLSRDGASTFPTPPAKVPQKPAEKDEEPTDEAGPIP